jgi:hypothetical protein
MGRPPETTVTTDDAGLLATLRRRLATALGTETQRAPITVVSGLPRSGTSMMMQMLERGGLEPLTDHEREPDEDNPEGYYELERVKALPEGETDWLDRARGRAVKIVSALLHHLPEDHTYRVLFMRRDIDEVLASQRKMLERQGRAEEAEDGEELRRQFLAHLEDVQAWADERSDLAMLTVDYNAIVDDPRAQLRRVDAFLDHASLDVEAMADVVDPDLYRQRK